MKKRFLGLIALCLGITAGALVGCGEEEGVDEGMLDQIYSQYVASAEEAGEEPLSFDEWIESLKGDKGDKGDKGETGKSAYQIWLDNGNAGTEEDFLEWLKGEEGETGKSAYQIWLDNGNTGTEEDFLEWLKGEEGETGKSAYQIWLDNGNTGTEEDFLEWLKADVCEHTYGAWTPINVETDNGAKLYYRICGACGEFDWKEVEADLKITSVEIQPTTTKFSYGQSFAFDGKVVVSYANGSVNENYADYTVDASAYDAYKLGTHTIKIKVDGATYSYDVEVEKANKIKVLMIANSYGDDTSDFVPLMAKELGFTEIEVGVLYIGGCSIDTHYENSQTGGQVYSFRYFENGSWTMEVGGVKQSLEYGIKYKDWDFITLQQASDKSGYPETYENLDELISYVKDTATNPDVRLIWNMTWAYQNGYSGLNVYYGDGTTQMQMYNKILNSVQTKVVPNDSIDLVLPVGTAIQNARSSYLGDTFNRDYTHLSLDLGRYIAGMTLFCSLTGYAPSEVNYEIYSASVNGINVAKESVANALSNKYAVTQSAYTENVSDGKIKDMLNDCDYVGGWVGTSGTVSASAIRKEGSYSFKVVVPTNGYITISMRHEDILDENNVQVPLTTEELLAYEYLLFDIYNENESTVALKFFNGTTATNLQPGWNEVRLETVVLRDIIAGSALQFAGGAFYFKVDKDAVLYFDNVRGVKTDSGETPKKTEDILHACDSVAGIAVAGVSNREVSTEHVTQGDYSVKGTVTTAGQDGGGYSTWLIYLKKDGKVPTIAELTAYDYIELSVYTESAGNIYVHNTIIQALTAGQNTVKLSTAKLMEVLEAWDDKDFNPYHESEGYIDFKIAVQLNTSVWIDNVRGVYPTE